MNMKKLHRYWNEYGTIHWPWLEEDAFVDYIGSKLEGFENIHDFGCGDGRLALRLSEKYPEKRISGYDIRIDDAKTRFESEYGYVPENVSFLETDLEKTEIPEESLDCGIAAFLFEYTSRKPVSRISRGIRKDGTFIWVHHRNGIIGKVAEKEMANQYPFRYRKGFKHVTRRLKKWNHRAFGKTLKEILMNGFGVREYGTYLDSRGGYSARFMVFDRVPVHLVRPPHFILTYNGEYVFDADDDGLRKMSDDAIGRYRRHTTISEPNIL
jgi:SAM-dependent methyltransferase